MRLQAESEQSWNVMLPEPPPASANVALNVGQTVRVPSATPPAAGTLGDVMSREKLRAADHAEALPAASCARTRTKYAPSPSEDGVQVARPPLESVADVFETTTPVQAASEQIWNETAPVSEASALLNAAASDGRAVRTAPSAGPSSVGADGAVVSRMKERSDDHADWLPAASCARTRQ